jgi:hypothetical protein
MKLTTVVGAANLNPEYYMFVPKQILFWGHFNIKFIAIIVGEKIPDELKDYSDNIILWNKNLNLNGAFVAQNIRIYIPALLNLPEDEMVMITDMDMLPMNDRYYKDGLELYKKEDFIYYRYIDSDQIFMCYNAAHPSVWSSVFSISNEEDIKNRLNQTYNSAYSGVPGNIGWFTDQQIMYEKLINYENLKVLNRPIKRLEMYEFERLTKNGLKNFISNFDDSHFHRSYHNNIENIKQAELQLLGL